MTHFRGPVMRLYNLGSVVRVTVSEREVDAFNSRWPGSSLAGLHAFEFEVRSGDLVGHDGRGDGPEAVALADDAQRWAWKRLGLKLVGR